MLGVVFDLDGVIWDLRPHIALLLNLDHERVHRYLTDGGNVLDLARRHGLSARQLGSELAKETVVTGDVTATLDYVLERGGRLAAATSLSRHVAAPIVQAASLDQRFEAICYPGAGRRAKPAPDGLLAAARDLEAAEYWYVGDTPVDAEAADAAGWRFAWAAYGYGPRPEAADAEISTISELPEVLGLS